MGLLQELKRRNVIRVAMAYVVTAWLLMQVADLVLDNIGAPSWVMQSVLLLLAIGLPLALIFAWAFELTPEGIRREKEVDPEHSITTQTGRKLDYVIIALLAVVALSAAWQATETSLKPEPVTTQKEEAPETASSNQALAPEIAPNTIAVLPFANLSSDPEQEFFSDGISEELLNVLAQYPGLRVAARTSSFQFKGDNRNISEIARLLKVNHVLEGSVRKAGSQLRITAQLIDARSGYHLWSETYDRELKDVFAIQDEISSAIGEELRRELKLPAIDGEAPKVAKTGNTAAYEAYLRGRHLINQRGNKAITEAVEHLQKSIRLDPEFAPARAQLAIAYSLLGYDAYGDLSIAEVNERATPHLNAAIDLNPKLPESWAAKSRLAQLNGEHAKSLEYAEHALELNPTYVDAMHWASITAESMGKYRQAQEFTDRAMKADPLSLIGRREFAVQIAYTDPRSAAELAESLIEESPLLGYSTMWAIRATQGDLSQALSWLLKAFELDPDYLRYFVPIGEYFGAVGLRQEQLRLADDTGMLFAFTREDQARAADILAQRLAQHPENGILRYFFWFYNAYYAGRLDQALKLLRERHRNSNEWLPFDGIRDGVDPSLKYAWLLARAGNEAAADRMLDRIEHDLDNRVGTRIGSRPVYFWDRGRLSLLRGDPEVLLEYLAGAPAADLPWLHELRDPMLAPVQDDPRFHEAISRYEQWIEIERAEILDLICNHNPVPDSWQPLPETCENQVSQHDTTNAVMQ